VPFFFKYGPTDLNVNMNKTQGTLFNFGVKKSRIEFVCDATNSDSSTLILQSDLQDVQSKGKTNSTQKKKSAFTRKNMDRYLKVAFIQCCGTNQLPRPNVSFVLLFWETKLWEHRNLLDISTQNIKI
jgi:hypothetical protein